LRYRRTIEIPGWIGSRQDLIALSELMDESLKEYRAAAVEETTLLDRAIEVSSPEIRALVQLLYNERKENQERDWETTAEVIESRTGLVRTGAAETVINRVEARYITELSLYAPKQARGPQLTVRFRPDGVEVEAVGDDESWVRGQSNSLVEKLSGRLPGVFALRSQFWITVMSIIVLLPIVPLMVNLAHRLTSRFTEVLATPLSFPLTRYPQPIAHLFEQYFAAACWLTIGLTTVVAFSGVSKVLLTFAQRSLPLFQVLSDDRRWRGQSAIGLVGAVLVSVLSGVVANILYAAYVS